MRSRCPVALWAPSSPRVNENGRISGGSGSYTHEIVKRDLEDIVTDQQHDRDGGKQNGKAPIASIVKPDSASVRIEGLSGIDSHRREKYRRQTEIP